MNAKRIFDLFVLTGILFFLWPLLIMVVIIILLIDGSPVLFKQWRIGKDSKAFIVYKFRTMRDSKNQDDGMFDAGCVSRVTTTGGILRRLKIDELPQLYNVLRGDMSFVGPRPEVKRWVDVFPERWRRVHDVLPGITDPASIVYRNEEKILAGSDNPEAMYLETILPHKLDLYEHYIANQSFFGDIKILFQTVGSIFK